MTPSMKANAAPHHRPGAGRAQVALENGEECVHAAAQHDGLVRRHAKLAWVAVNTMPSVRDGFECVGEHACEAASSAVIGSSSSHSALGQKQARQCEAAPLALRQQLYGILTQAFQD